MPKQNAPTREIKRFRIQIEGWGLPITWRGYDAEDAIELARISYKYGSERKITAIEVKDEPEPPPAEAKRRTGRPALGIPAQAIEELLAASKNVSYTAHKLGCSRGYIHATLGAANVARLISASSNDLEKPKPAGGIGGRETKIEAKLSAVGTEQKQGVC